MSERIRDAAQLLLQARRNHLQVAPPPWNLASQEEIYRVQDHVRQTLGGEIAGWKVGARSREAVPNCAPLLAPARPSPARFDPAAMHLHGYESEISFRLGRDLPASTSPVAPADALAAIASAHPTIEVCDTRLIDFRAADPGWMLADNQGNYGLVVGPAWHGWRQHDWARQPVHLQLNGSTVEQKNGGLAAVDPLPLVAWLIDHVVRYRGGLRAGQYITTGSWTGLRFTEPAAEVLVSFEGIGQARLVFSS